MSTLVAYYFAYGRHRPKSEEEFQLLFGLQVTYVKIHLEDSGRSVAQAFSAVLLNRDRHFAETAKFRQAVRRAKELDTGLIVGDLLALLSSTHPDQVREAMQSAMGAGVPLVDARTGGPLSSGLAERMVRDAQTIGIGRRGPIQRGLRATRAPKRKAVPENQVKAAKGAARAADARALRLRPVVDEIRLELGEGAALTSAVLARELNARSIPTDRGKAFSTAAARALLLRLTGMTASKG